MAPKRKSMDGVTEPKSKKAKVIADQIHQACFIGETEKVHNLLNQIPEKHTIKPEIDSNRTLHVVSKSGNVTIVKELLKRTDIEIDTLCCHDEQEMVEDYYNNSTISETALHIASEKGHLEVVKELLEKGAHPKAMNDSQAEDTPLHYAAANGHVEIVQEILKSPLIEINVVNL